MAGLHQLPECLRDPLGAASIDDGRAACPHAPESLRILRKQADATGHELPEMDHVPWARHRHGESATHEGAHRGLLRGHDWDGDGRDTERRGFVQRHASSEDRQVGTGEHRAETVRGVYQVEAGHSGLPHGLTVQPRWDDQRRIGQRHPQGTRDRDDVTGVTSAPEAHDDAKSVRRTDGRRTPDRPEADDGECRPLEHGPGRPRCAPGAQTAVDGKVGRQRGQADVVQARARDPELSRGSQPGSRATLMGIVNHE
jgi:hypothetical protein